jgi:hypothetical protein
MLIVFKLFLFAVIFSAFFVAAYKLYKVFNEKIIHAASGWGLLGYILLLVIANMALLFGGLFALIKLYGFLLTE